MSAGLRLAAVIFGVATVLPLSAQTPVEPARELVREVICNELHDRERDSHWEYRSQRVSSSENLIRDQVETDEGPIFRILARDGRPLDTTQQEHEDERLAAYVLNRGQIARVEREHQEDENRLAEIMELLPRAFLFEYQGRADGDLQQIKFQPDPGFVPSGYEARILHALAGTLIIHARLKRMVDLRGVIVQRVDFGYGLLGHVDPGGSVEIHRRQVNGEHWKTDLVDVHVQGRILMLKTVSKDQREIRSDFRPVPRGTTLDEARQMMDAGADRRTQAQLSLEPARAAQTSSNP